MTLTKHKMIAEIGRRTRLKNRDVQLMLEALVELWSEELVEGGRIELESFLILETKTIDRGSKQGVLVSQTGSEIAVPQAIRRVILRMSKQLRQKLNTDQ